MQFMPSDLDPKLGMPELSPTNEGEILRYVFWHSLVLACLVGVLVYLQAYVPPFTSLVVK